MDDTTETPLAQAIAQVRALLDEATGADSATTLEALGKAHALLSSALNEAMAASLLDGASIRQVGAAAGLSPNAVPPRAAQSPLLTAYAPEGRLTRAGIERARYDAERGTPLAPDQPQPLTFRRRRSKENPDD